MKPVAVTIGCATALLLGACNLTRPPQKKPINFWLADARDLANVRRIMILPFTAESGVDADLDALRSVYITELQKLRRFEIVPLPKQATEDEVINDTLRHGSISTDAVVRLCERYHLDGLLTGVVTTWRAYLPPHLGLRTQLVSVHSGSTVWAVDALYDANDQSTVSDLQLYHEAFQADDGSLHGWRMDTIAPTRFASYVAHRLVGTWTEN
jgi:TolB-like protein